MSSCETCYFSSPYLQLLLKQEEKDEEERLKSVCERRERWLISGTAFENEKDQGVLIIREKVMASVKKTQLNHVVIYLLNRLRYIWGGIHGPELRR